MSARGDDDPQLSNLEATALINEIAKNPAAKILPTKHAFVRQSTRVIHYSECILALQNGSVSGRRAEHRTGKTTYLYSVEYEAEHGPVRIVIRIKSRKLLTIITAIAL